MRSSGVWSFALPSSVRFKSSRFEKRSCRPSTQGLAWKRLRLPKTSARILRHRRNGGNARLATSEHGTVRTSTNTTPQLDKASSSRPRCSPKTSILGIRSDVQSGRNIGIHLCCTQAGEEATPPPAEQHAQRPSNASGQRDWSVSPTSAKAHGHCPKPRAAYAIGCSMVPAWNPRGDVARHQYPSISSYSEIACGCAGAAQKCGDGGRAQCCCGGCGGCFCTSP
mmetsp:Transcript_65745/g.183105  ORF Transcript_65745/g.183105 Transcript_65745/m.183105 type:complete len:224 (+) Transcript_65745:790-1461(+)